VVCPLGNQTGVTLLTTVHENRQYCWFIRSYRVGSGYFTGNLVSFRRGFGYGNDFSPYPCLLFFVEILTNTLRFNHYSSCSTFRNNATPI